MTQEHRIETFEAETYQDGTWWMVRIPQFNGLTQAPSFTEAGLAAREWIALHLNRPLNKVAINITEVTE